MRVEGLALHSAPSVVTSTTGGARERCAASKLASVSASRAARCLRGKLCSKLFSALTNPFDNYTFRFSQVERGISNKTLKCFAVPAQLVFSTVSLSAFGLRRAASLFWALFGFLFGVACALHPERCILAFSLFPFSYFFR